VTIDRETLISRLAREHDWVLMGAPEPEGSALRQLVLQNGERAYLYVFQSAEVANRVSYCHHGDIGAQLFVVPERIDSGDRWCLLRHIEGMTLSNWLKANPHHFSKPDGIALIQDLGEQIRKVHSTLGSVGFFGDFLDESRQWLTFNGYVASAFESYAEDVRTLGLDDVSELAVAKAIGEMRHELASFHPRSPTVLCHGKLAFEHIWVSDSGREVTGLTGFETACAMPPEVDIAWLLWIEKFHASDDAIRALYRGFGAARTMDVQRREIFYKRLIALHALYGGLGVVNTPVAELVELITTY
jgi:aminoglycoside phosphotransferase (APT) family kinase protein